MMAEPIWSKYVVYDESGHVSGVQDDAPQEVKDAYKAYVEEQKAYERKGKFIPR